MSEAARRWNAVNFPGPVVPEVPGPRPPAPLSVVKRQVQVLMAQARQEADQLRCQAEQRGLEEGLARLQGVQEQHVSDLRESLDGLQRLCQETWDRMRAEMEEHLLEMTLELSRSVIREEILSSPERLMGQIRQGLDRLGEKQGAVVRLHPDDCASLQGSLAQLRLLADPDLERGDFVAESEGGIVDGRLSRRMELLRKQLSA